MEFEKHCLASTGGADLPKAQAAFLGTVVSKFTSEGFHTLRRYLCTTADAKSVVNLLLRAQRYTDAGSTMALRALAESDMREKQGILAVSVFVAAVVLRYFHYCTNSLAVRRVLQEASRVFGLGKDTSLYKSCTDDQLELLKDQEVLRTKYSSHDVAPFGSSVTGTMSALIHFAANNEREQHRLLADADKIAKKFRVPEKRACFIKVKAFAESSQWANLRILADSKKSPIGYKAFARAAIKGKQPTSETMRYIDRLTTPEEKYDMLCEAKLWKNALDEAVKLRDTRRILNVKSLCNDADVQIRADQMLGRLA
jgi:hypothetical protein